uniref:Regulatory protein zeste n=1 Tax=Acrobeloides nanus TaxID=290746 RepID=A0A914D2F0_9BILA
MSNRKPVKRSRDESQNIKNSILKDILAKKNILFGKFSPVLTQEKKINTWDEVRKNAIAAGETSLTDKNAEYMSKTYWQNRRKEAIDRKMIGQDPTENDLLVFSIMGPDASSGMNVPESYEELGAPGPSSAISSSSKARVGATRK